MYATRMAFPEVERETKSATFLSFAYWMKNSDEKQKNKVMLWKDIRLFFHPNLLYYGLLIVNLNVIFFSSRKQLYCTKGRERKREQISGYKRGSRVIFFSKKRYFLHKSIGFLWVILSVNLFNSYFLKTELYAKFHPSEATMRQAGP